MGILDEIKMKIDQRNFKMFLCVFIYIHTDYIDYMYICNINVCHIIFTYMFMTVHARACALSK